MATLSEAESKALLARHGVPVPAEAVVATPEEAAEAAGAIGFPVVVKLCGQAIAHKTERGLVKLGLRDAAAVTAAAAELLAAARPEDGDVGPPVGPVRVDPERDLGGDRGPDGRHRLDVPPGLHLQLHAAVPLLDVADDLGPVRGEPPVDRAALAGILLGLAAVAEGDDRIRSIDLNPLIVCDGVPLAVDALIEIDA